MQALQQCRRSRVMPARPSCPPPRKCPAAHPLIDLRAKRWIEAAAQRVAVQEVRHHRENTKMRAGQARG